MKSQKSDKITTIKLKKETKQRLDHLREYSRESYEEILKKTLYILNTLRTNPDGARSILRNIDFKLKRKPVYPGIPQEEKQESEKVLEKETQVKQPTSLTKLNPIQLRLRRFRK